MPKRTTRNLITSAPAITPRHLAACVATVTLVNEAGDGPGEKLIGIATTQNPGDFCLVSFTAQDGRVFAFPERAQVWSFNLMFHLGAIALPESAINQTKKGT